VVADKKILIIVGDPEFDIGNKNSAIAIYINQLRQYLIDCGNQVFVCSAKSKNDGAPVAPLNANSRFGPVKRLLKKKFPVLISYLQYLHYEKKQEVLKGQIHAFCKNQQIDFYIELPVYGSYIGAWLKKLFGKPLIILFDSPLVVQYAEFNKAGIQSRKIKKAEKINILNAGLIITYSRAVEEWIRKNYETGARFMQMPCIVWKDEVTPAPHETINIGFVGSFLPWHRVADLVKAFEKLCKEFPAVRLYLIGYGMEWESVNALVVRSPYRDRIIITGFVAEEKLTEVKKILDIGVMPGSNWYGSPLKLFEFAQSGITIVTTNSPTISEYFKHGETAYVLGDGSVEDELVKALRTLIVDKQLRVSIGVNGRKMMELRLNKAQLFDQLTRNIQEVIQ
jgi:glycosyltransferase involved in cell wall biosynthesis